MVNAELSLKQLAELCDTTARPAQAAEWRRKLAEFQKAQGSTTNVMSQPK